MAKWLVKVSKSGGQYRITLPKGLMEDLGWCGVEFLLMIDAGMPALTVRRFIDGESLKNDGPKHQDGSD